MRGSLRHQRRGGPGGPGRQGDVPKLAGGADAGTGPATVRLPGIAEGAPGRHCAPSLPGHRQDLGGRSRGGMARHRSGRVRVQHRHVDDGRNRGERGPGHRHLQRGAADRCLCRDHTVQLPGHGAAVDVSAGHRLWQYLRVEAVRAGSPRSRTGSWNCSPTQARRTAWCR